MKKENVKKTSIGGQAVIEGVMMRGATAAATAVRDESGKILIEARRLPENRGKITKIPVIRGVVCFFDSLVGGTRALSRSASVFGEEETSKFDDLVEKKTGVKAADTATFFGVALGLLLSLFLFFYLPQKISDLLPFVPAYSGWYFLCEGLVRILIFILYILLTSLFKDVRRTYMYHGAEHKTISCYEKGLPLTVENVKKCTRLHDRCGTTFTFIVMFISILVFSLVSAVLIKAGLFFDGIAGRLFRFGVKLLFLPLVAGISYEILKLLAKTTSPLVFIFKAPGLALQKLTTREPDDGMIEVAVAAFNKVLEMDEDKTVPECDFGVFGNAPLLLKKVKEILLKGGVTEESDAEWIVSRALSLPRSEILNKTITVPVEKYEIAMDYAKKRAEGIPLQYVFGDTDFYGFILKTDERALIPRPETEELVEAAVKTIKETDSVLDLCTGSGAIAVVVKKKTNAAVTASDISEKALSLAKENAAKHDADVNFVLSDVFENINGKFNVIISNPPYIKTSDIKGLQKEVLGEPLIALDGGEDGLDFYRKIAKNAADYLFDNGAVFLECGAGEAEDIVRIFKETGNYRDFETIKDLSGIERIIKVIKL